MDVETLLKETKGSVANLSNKELQDLDKTQVQMTTCVQFNP